MRPEFIQLILGAATMLVGVLIGGHIACASAAKKSPLKLPSVCIPGKKKLKEVKFKEPDKRFS